MLRSSGLLEETLFRQALGHHQAGRLRDAEAAYRDVLAAIRVTPARLVISVCSRISRGTPRPASICCEKPSRRTSAMRSRITIWRACCPIAAATTTRSCTTARRWRSRPTIPVRTPISRAAAAARKAGRGLGCRDQGIAVRGVRKPQSTFGWRCGSLDPATIQIDRDVIRLLVRALTEPWCRPRDLSRPRGRSCFGVRRWRVCVARLAQAGPVAAERIVQCRGSGGAQGRWPAGCAARHIARHHGCDRAGF